MTGLETTVRAGRSWVQNPGKENFVFSPDLSDRLWGPPSLHLKAYRDSFPVVKRPGRAAEQSPPIPRLRMRGAIILLPPYDFMARKATILQSDI